MNTAKGCDAAFKREVRLRCYDALEAAGFTRYKREGVDWPMEHGFHCWVGLNTALEADYVEINPFVGVHAVPVMRFYTALEGRPYNRGVATYAVHMGLLIPRERVIRFSRDTDIAAEADRLTRLYVDAGLPYAMSIGTYERLLPLLLDRVAMLGAYPERIAACLYMMGRKQEARMFAENFLLDQPDYFEGFAVPFLKLLDGEDR